MAAAQTDGRLEALVVEYRAHHGGRDARGEMMGTRVGFVPLYRIEYPSSRYRVFQFLKPLQRLGFKCALVEAPQKNLWMRLLYMWRLLSLARCSDVLYVQKRVLPVWALSLVQRANPNIVYDLDDAIYVRGEHRGVVDAMMQHAACVVAGNETLAAYARQHSERVMVVPSVVDTDQYRPPAGPRHPGDERTVIGWIGIDPNRGDLDLMPHVFDWLGERYGSRVVLRIVSGEPLKLQTRLQVEFVPWTLEGSRHELQQFDIGIMPLDDSEWNRAKCGLKLIQYLAVGTPAVASPVGVNREIIQDGRTGYLTRTIRDWRSRLQQLIDDPVRGAAMGRAGRARIEERYSVDAVLPKLCKAIEEGARRR